MSLSVRGMHMYAYIRNFLPPPLKRELLSRECCHWPGQTCARALSTHNFINMKIHFFYTHLYTKI